MHLSRKGLRKAVLIGVALLSMLQGALAQETAAPAAQPPATPQSPSTEAIPLQANEEPAKVAGSDAAPEQLTEVVVTATKRDQSARDIPGTINVLNGTKLETQGARQLKDFIDQVPGVKMQESFGGPDQLAIRGIGPQSTIAVSNLGGGGTNQTVGILYGDIPLTDPYSAYTAVDPDPWDLKDVEVLKGPQGTLFGASSEAGMVRYVPNSPVLGTWEAKSFAEWDSVKYGGTEPSFGAAINVPLGSTLAFRASGVVEHTPGLIDIDTVNRHVANADDTHRWQGRAMVLWKPLDRLTVNGWWLDQQTHADELGFVSLPFGKSNGQFERNDAPDPSPSHRSLGLGSLDIRYAFDWATLVSLTGLQHKTSRVNLDSTFELPGEIFAQNGIDVTHTLSNARTNGTQQEIRLVSPNGGPWVWLAGAFYSAYHGYVEQDLYVPNTAALGDLLSVLPDNLGSGVADENGLSVAHTIINPLTAHEEAVFGELTRKQGPLDITLGGRLYRTSVSGTEDLFSVVNAVSTGSTENTFGGSVDSKGFSPKASLSLHATKDLMFYATASRGFQYGGFNALAFNVNHDPTEFKSSTLWNYEVGVRSEWFQHSLRFDLAAFYIDWKDAQIQSMDTSGIAFVFSNNFTTNVGAVRSRGLESTIRYLPPWIRGLSFEVNGSYDEAKTTVPFTSSEGSVAAGVLMPNAPTLQLASTLAYHCAIGPWSLQPTLVYTHTNTSWNDIFHDHLLDTRDLFNGNVSLTRTDLPFSPALTVVVNNITDQKKVTQYAGAALNDQALDNKLGLGAPTINYTRPRTIQLRLSLDF